MDRSKKIPVKYDKLLLTKICEENKLELREDYDHITGATIIRAKCIVENCDKNMVEKSFKQLINNNNYGCVDHKQVIALGRRKATNIQIFGNENPAATKECQIKSKETFLKIYGQDHPNKVPEIIEKRINTNMIRYGGPAPISSPEIKEKTKNTNMKRHGCEYVVAHPKTRQKIKDTNLKNLGVESPFLHPQVRQKNQ